MKDKTKTLLLIATLVIVIFYAYHSYNTLAKNYKLAEKENLEFSGSTENKPEVKESKNTLDSTTGSPENSSDDESTNNESDGSSSNKDLAPDFTVNDIDGNELKLSSFFGKPIVVNFWASWCPPCKDELPDFEKVYNELEEDIEFLMINMTDGKRETFEIASKFIADSGYTFPVYYDTLQEAAYAYGITSIPMTIFIDKDGSIVTGQRGKIDEDLLRKGISFIYP